VMGSQNVIEAAIDTGVKKVVALSTDKASSPINLYGATKLCADKLFVAANSYSGDHVTRFSTVRYGNVVGSRGSVVPFFLKFKNNGGVIPITDPRMTRFWITLSQGVQFVLDSLAHMEGGEIFVPRIPSMNIMDLAKAVAPECEHRIVGIRPGEKLHEVMVPEDDARRTLEFERYFAILPNLDKRDTAAHRAGRPCPDGFRYGSDNNSEWLTVDGLRTMLKDVEIEPA